MGPTYSEGFLVAQTVENPPQFRRPEFDPWDPLEDSMANDSSILPWRIPCTEEPCGLQSMGSQRVGKDWACTHIRTHKPLCFPRWPTLYLWDVFLSRSTFLPFTMACSWIFSLVKLRTHTCLKLGIWSSSYTSLSLLQLHDNTHSMGHDAFKLSSLHCK